MRIFLFIILLALERTKLSFAEDAIDSAAPTEATEVTETQTQLEPEPTPKPEPKSELTPKPEPVAVSPAVSPMDTTPTNSTNPTSPFALGIQGGQALTNSSLSGNRQKIQVFGGAHLEFQFRDQLSLQAELNYIEKGWRLLGGVPQDEVSLKYLEIPLFLKAKWTWNNLAPHVFAGPSLAYLHAAKRLNNGITFDTTSGTSRIEYSVYLGAGLDVLISKDLEVGANLRYGWGLSDLNKDVLEPDVFNRVFQWVGTLRFRL